MKLYHFTAREHADGVERWGIRGGSVPLAAPKVIVDRRTNLPVKQTLPPRVPGQWLTDDPDFGHQAWARDMEITKCDRTEVRFTLVIPKTARKRLVPWLAFADRYVHDKEWLAAFGRNTDEHWFVFVGANIPAGWIRARDDRDGPPPALDEDEVLALAGSGGPVPVPVARAIRRAGMHPKSQPFGAIAAMRLAGLE